MPDLGLPHPIHAGFALTLLAEPNGQIRDWVMPVTDGSRIHVHEFGGGRLVAHRDAVDPSRGPVEAIDHWVTESNSGRFVLAMAGCIGGVALLAFVVAAIVRNNRGR